MHRYLLYRESHRESQRKYREKNGKKIYEKKLEWRRRNPLKWSVQQMMMRKKERFPLVKFCELCPEDDKRRAAQRHHPDYDEAEVYVSVCSSCHKYTEWGR